MGPASAAGFPQGLAMGRLARAKVAAFLALRRVLRRPVRLGYPLDGLSGHFPRAYARRPPEVHYVNAMVEHLRRDYVCFDVGAYLGYYTLLCARYARQVVAFEPLPANLAALRRNVRRNRLANVRVCGLAIGAAKGIVQLRAHQGADSMASAFRTEGACTVEAPATDLDSFCAENALSPDLVKIDVEGGEAEVLRGMERVLAEKRPILFLELHTAYLSEAQVDEILSTLRERSYRVWSWLEDVDPGGHGFWRHQAEVHAARDLRVGATLALPD
jgi:FkbM family methyltransferase